MEKLPKSQDLVPTILRVLAAAGRPMTNSEIENRVIEELSIPKELCELIHTGKRTELQYRLAWAKTKAKSEGRIRNNASKTWEII